MTIKEEKAILRKEIRAARRALDKDKSAAWSSAIEKTLLELDEYKTASTVFCFVSMEGEPNTQGILQRVLDDKKRLFVPRTRPKGVMELVEITSLAHLKTGFFGIQEPDDSLPHFPPEIIDFAVVPALAFSKTGERLGQGGGYYDRFAEKTQACLCGVAYSAFIYDNLPCEGFDKKVDFVVTEDKKYKFV